MLMIGTNAHLEDLDRSYTYAQDVSVTALAVGSFTGGVGSLLPSSNRPVWSLLDAQRIVGLEEFDVVPFVRLPNPTAQSLAVAGDTLVVGVEGGHLLTVSPDGTISELPAFDALEGRDAWQNPAGSTPDLRSIAVSSDDSHWFANVHVGGVWRSDDGGGSWRCVVQPESDVHEVVTGQNRRVAVAAAIGFGLSEDDGDTWQWTTDGLHASYSRAVALDGDTAFVTASTGPETGDGRLYRCRLGEPFEPCAGGLPESFPFNLDTGSVAAADGQVALGTRNGRVFRSSDHGSTWALAAEGMRPVRVVRFS